MNTLKIEPAAQKRKQSTLSLPGTFSAACLFAGIGGCFYTMFVADLAWALLLATGLTVVLLSWLLRRARFAPLFMVGLISIGATIGLFQFDLADGLLSFADRISTVLGAHLGENLARYTTDRSGEFFAAMLLSALLAWGCVWLVKMRSVLIASLIILPVAALELMLDLVSAPLSLMLLFAGMLLLHLPEMLLTHDSKASFLSWMIFAFVASAIFYSATCVLEKIEIPHVAEARKAVLERIENARFGESELTRGDFSELGILESAADPMLEITMSKPESLYLRGFIGSEYHADGWETASNVDLSDGADLFYWLHDGGFYGQTQLANLAMLLDDGLTVDDAIEISVRHLGENRQYIYAPYELLWAELLNPASIGDVNLKSKRLTGAGSYSLIAIPNQVKRYNLLLYMLNAAEQGAVSDELSAYLVSESHYNSFVYDHFLSISGEITEMLSELLGAADFGDNPHLDYGEAKQRILEFFNESVAYCETTPPRIEETDFLKEFLIINQSGYDVHYATAAVMMMRYFGIPARYVEGYLITPADADVAESAVPFTLNGDRAHAWCEIYQDGIGWVPFEVTPKYMDLMERSDVVRTANNSEDNEIPTDAEDNLNDESSLDMEEDFHDDFEDEEDPDDNPFPLGWLMVTALGLLILLLLIALNLWLSARIAIARLNHSLRLRDRKKAVQNLYAYLFALMKEIYGWHNCIAPSGFLETVRADQGEDAAIKYEKIVEICEAAAFDVHSVLEEDYLFVYNFVRKTRLLLKNRSKFGRRLKLRYMRHLI